MPHNRWPELNSEWICECPKRTNTKNRKWIVYWIMRVCHSSNLTHLLPLHIKCTYTRSVSLSLSIARALYLSLQFRMHSSIWGKKECRDCEWNKCAKANEPKDEWRRPRPNYISHCSVFWPIECIYILEEPNFTCSVCVTPKSHSG